MIYLFDATGRCAQSTTAKLDQELLDELVAISGAACAVLSDIEYDPRVIHLTAAGEIAELPPQPDEWHVWSYPARAWQRLPQADIDARLTERVRAERARLFAACDWSQLPDVPPATTAAWAPYRQALRDITAQAGFPQNIVWPTSP